MTREPRKLLAFLAAGALFAGAPTVAHGHGTEADGAPAPAPAPTGSAEAKLRAFETQAIGAEHAAAHARQRELAQETPRDRSATQVQAQAAPPPVVALNVGGKWDDARTIPVIAINAIMLPTGKVLMFAYPARPGYEDPGDPGDYAKAYVWDPVSGTSNEVPPPIDPATGKPTNIWCGGASFLPNGHVLISGGNVDDPRTDFHGLDTVFTFDPVSEQWATNPPMAQGRWYPTQVLMPDGRTLIAGGLTRPGDPDFGGGNNTDNDLELISPNGAIERQPGFFNGAGDPPLSGLYPRMFWMPSGRALSVGPFASDTWSVAPSSPGTPAASTDIPDLSADREWGTAVLLSAGRVMMLGGSALASADPPEGELPSPGTRPAQRTTEIFDESNPGSGWQAGTQMAVGRSHANSVLLPDGKVATVGGGFGEDSGQEFYRWLFSEQQKRVELFNPASPSTPPVLGNAQAEGRTYHSTALLLPDGRVMSAGDDINGPGGAETGTNSDTAEIYSPPYLFNANGSLASRPVIGQAPTSAQIGTDFEVGASGAAATKAVLVAPGAATHATDMSQRLVPLAAPQPVPGQPGRLTLTLPSNVNLAPPGYYMLFLLSANGVPSVAEFIRITPPTDTTPPVVTLTAPADGSSTYAPTYAGQGGNLTGDRAAVTVRVYAGTTTTGTPVQTRTAPRSGTNWTVGGSPALAPGTYTARAEQSDYAGNAGLSGTTTFTVPRPTPPPPVIKPKLTLTGRLPHMRTLKRKQRFTITVQASEPGKVTLTALLERGRRPAKSLAKQRALTFKAAGKRRVTFKLTRAGRRLLNGKSRGVVRIRAKAFFTSKRTLPVVQVRRKLR